MSENVEIWGEKYRLVRGKGFGQAVWGVISRDGRTEVASGQLYEAAKEIYDRCESSCKKPGRVRASLNTAIIDQEDSYRAERRSRTRSRVLID